MAQDVALVTGASAGIGAALARRIAREGKNVALVARRLDRLESLAREIERDAKVSAHAIASDLLAPGAPAELVAEVERRGLTVDWLVNNAGFGTVGRFYKLPVERELEELRLNVGVLMELTRRFLPAMVQRGRGAVMNISSMAAFAPGPYMATYCATKAFVLSFSESIANEVKDTGVHVLCVCPGFTRTEFHDVSRHEKSWIMRNTELTAPQVARAGLNGLVRGKFLIVPGWWYKTMWLGASILPRWVTSAISARMVK